MNIDADKIATTRARKIINTHLITQSFVVYINGMYIHQKLDQNIRRQPHYLNAKRFLKNDYSWSTTCIENIDWNNHQRTVSKLTILNKITAIKFFHHRLPVGKMQFNDTHNCPYCHQTQTHETSHNYFLLCNEQIKNKNIRIRKNDLY